MEGTKEQQAAIERFQMDLDGFKNDLFEVSEKFKRAFEVMSQPSYDGDDFYLGEVKYLKCGKNEHLSESLREIIEEFFGDIGLR